MNLRHLCHAIRLPLAWFVSLGMLSMADRTAAEQTAPEQTTADQQSAEQTPHDLLNHFEQHIRPVFVTQCLKCHSGDKPKGELRLDTRESLFQGGESGAAIDTDEPAASLLVSALRYESLEMPPDKPLQESEIVEIERWIENGAFWPEDTTLSAATSVTRQITDADRQHWSFQPISDPPITFASDDRWSRNPVDCFVYDKMQSAGVTPAPEADRRTLVRRVYFDLLGIPPTPEQVAQFVNNPADDAFDDLVDQLLSNPAYGERWARHWLDLVRYGESDGYRADSYRKNAWRYRDYVISSFNDDKPYDQFIREQLAGDEFYPDDPAAWVGTGYLRLHLYEYNQRDVITQRQDILNDITDVTADVFLGLGMKCARCHDHKFDPILQSDYFRIQSHFAALIPRDNVPLATAAELLAYRQKQDIWLEATKSIRDEIATIRRPYQEKQAHDALIKFTPDIKQIFDIPPDARSGYERQLMYFVDRQSHEEGNANPSKEDVARIEELEKCLAEFDNLKPAPLPHTESVTDTGHVAPPTIIPGRSDGTEIQPNTIQVISHAVQAVPAIPIQSESADSKFETTGRRTALAEWLTSTTNPLPARVAVNRIWQHHFGSGLVPTPSDFGKLGGEPSHPELLDWLAKRFIQDGWRWKTMHRMMVTSSTYRQSAHHPDAKAMEAIDPANRLRWRWDVRRLAAEPAFDALLSVSGQLDLSVGGASENDDSSRRAIYRKVFRNNPDKLLALFDLPDGINSSPKRPITTTPTQALALLNSEWGTTAAARMAERLLTECAGQLPDNAESASGERSSVDCQSDVITRAYEIAFARLPSDDERALAKEFLGDEFWLNVEPDVTTLAEFCHVLLNSNEFIYLD